MEKGLNIYGSTQIDNNEILNVLDEAGYYLEFNNEFSFYFIPEEEENYDILEIQIAYLLDQKGVNYRIEGNF